VGRAVVFEPGKFHDEVIPTLVHHLQGLGFESRVFLSGTNIAKDIFGAFADADRPRTRVMRVRDQTRRGVVGRRIRAAANRWSIEAANADVAVLNTVDGLTYTRFRSAHRRPRLLGIVHDGCEAAADPVLSEAAKRREIALLVLAPHVRDYLAARGIPSYSIRPVLLPRPPSVVHAPRVFCTQGKVEVERRCFPSLLDAAMRLVEGGHRDFVLRIVTVPSRGLELLRTYVDKAGLSAHFAFVIRVQKYGDYYGSIADTGGLFFLLDPSSYVYRPYIESKVSSSLGVAIGLGVPPVLDRDAALALGLQDVSYTHGTGRLEEAIIEALSTSDAQRRGLHARLESTRQVFLRDSADEMRRALEAVGA
jgi:hypothetical protein